jgi:tripartite-type tricarboxylate transporter receptor subunit TctC
MIFRQRREVLTAMVGGATLSTGLLSHSSMAQTNPQASASTWPNKPIKLIVGFPPGGLTDAYARMFAEQLTAKFGQPAVVENKPGAGAIIAIEAVTKSPPDGYTLLVTTTGAVWQNRVLYKKLPFDLDKDLTPVVIFPSGPLVVGVNEKLPIRNFKEFVEYAKKNPTSMGSYAPASYPHMVADQVNRAEGTQIAAIQYKGEAAMWVDIVSGQVQIAIGSYQAFATVQSRGVRAIGVTGLYRCPKLPDVPTLVEQGVGGPLVRLEGGLPVTAPTGTPQDVLQKLNQVALEGAEGPKAKALRETFAIPDKPVDLEATRKIWREVAPVWIKIAADLGVKLD